MANALTTIAIKLSALQTKAAKINDDIKALSIIVAAEAKKAAAAPAPKAAAKKAVAKKPAAKKIAAIKKPGAK